MEKGTERQTDIEALRIICMLLIISFHYAYKGGFTDDMPLINGYIIKMFWMFGELGVNCFMLITGYFMVESCFKLRKLILLWIQVEMYNVAVMLIAYRIGILQWTGKKGLYPPASPGMAREMVVCDSVCHHLYLEPIYEAVC